MHSIYSFLLNYEDIDSPSMESDEIKSAWLHEQAALLLFQTEEKDSKEINPEDLKIHADHFRKGLEEKWIQLSTLEKEQVTKDQIEKAKFKLIAANVEEELEQEYLDCFTDQNNSYQTEVAVFKNGVVSPLCDLDDWRGRGLTYYQYLLQPREKRWEKSFADAVRMTAYDFNIPGLTRISLGQPPTDMDTKIHSMTAEQLIENINEYVPRYMSQELLKYIGTVISRARETKIDMNVSDILNINYPSRDGFDIDTSSSIAKIVNSLKVLSNDQIQDGWMADYYLKKALEVYQSWITCMVAPFSTDYNNPYHNYRCYDVRPYDSRHKFIQDNSVIIEVDIHT